MAKFNYEGAKAAGYSDQEIEEFLGKPNYQSIEKDDGFFSRIGKNASNFVNNFTNPTGKKQIEEEPSEIDRINHKLLKYTPDFDVLGALNSGYSADEINEFLEERKPKRSLLEKGARSGAQYLLSRAEGLALPYEVASMPLRSKEAQNIPYRENVGQDIERLLEQKSMGQWDEQDQALYDSLVEQIKDPEKSLENVQTADIGVRGVAEKMTGIDFEPEGAIEKAASWAGLLRNPKAFADPKTTTKDMLKALNPTGSEILRGVGAGVALQAAEEGQFGPIGTLAAAVVGDAAGGGTKAAFDVVKRFAKEPKKQLAQVAAKFTSKDKMKLQKDIIEDFNKSGIQADLGTMTDSNIVKWVQSRLSQSGLVGKDLEKLRNETISQVKNEYKNLANQVGESKFATNYEAGQVAKETLKNIRDQDLAKTRSFYEEAKNQLTDKSYVDSSKIVDTIKRLEKELSPGQLKSVEQKAVLDKLDQLKRDVTDSEGKMIWAGVKDLMNNKIGLQDTINYEVQGGAKQLLKEVVKEIDRAIISHGKENPRFSRSYVNANKNFSRHAKEFRNKEISRLLNTESPEKILNQMNTLSGMKRMENILKKTPEGQKLYNDLKRLKMDQIFENTMVNSAEDQIKMGTFSNLLKKSKNRELIKEILGKDAYKGLQRLQKNAGKLAQTYDKYLNASQSGTVAADAAVIGKLIFNDLAHLLYLNPWPFLKTTAGLKGAKRLGRLLADKEFLKHVEEAIKAADSQVPQQMNMAIENLRPYYNLINQDEKR